MYICRDCKKIFDVTSFMTSMDFWGGPFEVRTSHCPNCKSEDYSEAKECEVCGEYNDEEDLIGGVCEDCIEKCRHDVDMCAEIGMESREEIRLNSFLAAMFDEKDIETILLEYLKTKNPKADCSAFIDSDVSWFAEQLIRQEAHL